MKDKSITCKKNIDKKNSKTENLNIKLSNEYEQAKLRLQEKDTLKKKLNVEIEHIKKVIKSVLFIVYTFTVLLIMLYMLRLI